MNAGEILKQSVLAILRSDRPTRDVEALTAFQVYGFDFNESQEQLVKAKAYLVKETAAANNPYAPVNGHATAADIVQAETIDAATEATEPVEPTDGASAQATGAQKAEMFIDPLPEVPASMKAKRQWVRWRLELRDGKWTKVPFQVNGEKAASDNPKHWTDYRTAVTGAVINAEQGVGFMFADGFAGIDLDGCRDPKTGDITKWAEDIIDSFPGDVYVEESPSGTGLHIFVLGAVPGTDRKFNLNPAIGYGKAAVEMYDSRRYFTVTGEAFFEEAGDVLPCDLTEVYNRVQVLRAANPAPRNERAVAADSSESTPIELLGTFPTSKYDIFTRGVVESSGDHKPFIISDGYGRLTYPSWSEADMAFMNVAAHVHDGDADKMWEAYRQSPLARNKWLGREADFRRNTIAKAIKSAAAFKEKNQKVGTYDAAPPATETPATTVSTDSIAPATEVVNPEVTLDVPTPAETTATFTPIVVLTMPSGVLEDKDIPIYDPAIECGYFKDVIDAVCNGTTIPRQFMYNVIQAFVGAYVSDVLKFENLDCNSCRYAVNIGVSGTSKRTVWDRGIGIFKKVLINQESECSVKVYDSVDSGAGLRDAFFEKPMDAPVFLMIDEAASLGNKSAETKNPEIVDTIIELADSTDISRVKAKKSQKAKSAKVHNNARLSMYMCAQKGEVVSLAFQGRKKQGIDERLIIEYSPAIEPGNLPIIPEPTKLTLIDQLIKLRNAPQWKKPITMTGEAQQALDQYWASQPDDVRTKVRLRRNLVLDVYMRAFSRGESIATLEDVRLCAEHFERDKIIRKVHFRGEIANKVSLYIDRFKTIFDGIRQELNAGKPIGWVAVSKRDLQTKTHAFEDNDMETFDRAFQSFGKTHLIEVDVKAANGHRYTKFIPMPYEHEAWDLSPGYRDFGSKTAIIPEPPPSKTAVN